MTRDEAMHLAIANGHDMEPWSNADPAAFSVSNCRRCRLRMYDLPDICGITATVAHFTCEQGAEAHRRLTANIMTVFDSPTIIVTEAAP